MSQPGCCVATVTLLVCIAGAACLKLPSYIPACARNDPDLNGCMKRNAELAIPGIVKGDRKYRIPQLEPFFISKIALEEESRQGAPGFSIILTNASLAGLSRAVVQDISVDFQKTDLNIVLIFPHLELQTLYRLSGNFQRFQFSGNGPGNINMTNVKVECKFHFKTEKKSDGLTYLIPTTPEIKFDIGGRLHLQLDNLLNGDKALGDNMNAILNDNWEELASSLGPGVADLLAALLQQTISGMFHIVPLEEIFL